MVTFVTFIGFRGFIVLLEDTVKKIVCNVKGIFNFPGGIFKAANRLRAVLSASPCILYGPELHHIFLTGRTGLGGRNQKNKTRISM